jgi:hypothetical protein
MTEKQTTDGPNPKRGAPWTVEYQREYDRKWKAAQRADPARRDAYNAYQREYRRTHQIPNYPECGERYRRAHLPMYAAKEARRRAHKRASGGSFTERDWQRIVHRYGGLCAYCAERPATTRDHVLPVCRGGTGYIGNILPACGRCNSAKRGLLLIEFKRRLGFARSLLEETA